MLKHYTELDLSTTYNNAVRCPDANLTDMMFNYIDKARKEGDTVGVHLDTSEGKLSFSINGRPLKEAFFDEKLKVLKKQHLFIYNM